MAQFYGKDYSHYFNDEDTFYFQVFLDRYYHQNLLMIDNNLPDDEAADDASLECH